MPLVTVQRLLMMRVISIPAAVFTAQSAAFLATAMATLLTVMWLTQKQTVWPSVWQPRYGYFEIVANALTDLNQAP